MNDEPTDNNETFLSVFQATWYHSLSLRMIFSLRHLPVVSSPLTFGLASNQNTSLHDVTTETVAESATIKNIKEINTAITWRHVVNSSIEKALIGIFITFLKCNIFMQKACSQLLKSQRGRVNW